VGSVHLVRLPRLGAGLSRKRFESLSRDLVHAAGGAGARCRARGLLEVVRVDSEGAWKGSALAKAVSGAGQAAVSGALEAEEDDVIVVAGGFGDNPYQALGAARLEGASRLAGASQGAAQGCVQELDMFWVTEFPLFEAEEDDAATAAALLHAGGDGGAPTLRLTPAHHPFTAPVEADMDVMRRASEEGWGKRATAEAVDQLACVRARSYDLVCDGSELGGGSVRLHRAEDQETVFSTLQLPEARIASFEHLLKALRWGAPPHAGLAIGLDRFVALLAGAKSLRDVIAFPKTAAGQDLLSGAPSAVPAESLAEYNIAVRERA
jgi:aspartyl-tRNA synthetase